MKIILAPDSFKGSLSAQQLCVYMRTAIERVIPHAEVIELPIADGGEGLLESLIERTGGTFREALVQDPNGHPVKARYGELADGETALIEMAQASGLTLVPEQQRNPLTASSFGTGQLIKHALDQGFRRIVIGIGGSATNDGGAGMLRALDVKLLDAEGRELDDGGAALSRLHRFDDAQLDARIRESEIIIVSDVMNPLCGPDGASVVFGPQKGADEAMVKELDDALYHYAEIIKQQKGIELRNIQGGGAAGGLGAALAGILNGKMRSGIDWVMEAVQIDQHLQTADLLITGEGRIDKQTLSGKAIYGLSKLAGQHAVPVVILCGSLQVAQRELDELGIMAAFSIVNGPCTLEEALQQTPQWLEMRMESICKLFNYFPGERKVR